ncbi:hypothetical protein GGX14DRAFT_398403 [Mycena pura]|uniref:Uncharacterized protein n=1 Tax=Mycena pura TaxID=153505 RepID=A0AAD6VA55_9AGAR|nr:hypothetical protein GGX14DRAFT_398403 [Mycena pura]
MTIEEMRCEHLLSGQCAAVTAAPDRLVDADDLGIPDCADVCGDWKNTSADCDLRQHVLTAIYGSRISVKSLRRVLDSIQVEWAATESKENGTLFRGVTVIPPTAHTANLVMNGLNAENEDNDLPEKYKWLDPAYVNGVSLGDDGQAKVPCSLQNMPFSAEMWENTPTSTFLSTITILAAAPGYLKGYSIIPESGAEYPPKDRKRSQRAQKKLPDGDAEKNPAHSNWKPGSVTQYCTSKNCLLPVCGLNPALPGIRPICHIWVVGQNPVESGFCPPSSPATRFI